MKTVKKYFILALVTIFSISCGSDDDITNEPNKFTINNIEYEIYVDGGWTNYFESLGQNGFDMYQYQLGAVAVEDNYIGFSLCWGNTIDDVTGEYFLSLNSEEAGWRDFCSNIELTETEDDTLIGGDLKVTHLTDDIYRIQFINGVSEEGDTFSFDIQMPLVDY